MLAVKKPLRVYSNAKLSVKKGYLGILIFKPEFFASMTEANFRYNYGIYVAS